MFDKQTDNPLQQPIWQPDLSGTGTWVTQSHPANTGHNFADIPVLSPNHQHRLQAKLTIGKPNDKYEQEADRVADQVMSMPASPMTLPSQQSGSGIIQRTCATCSKEYDAAAQEERPVDQENLCPQCRVQAKPLTEHITPLVQRVTNNAPEEDDEEQTIVQAKPQIQRQTDVIEEDEEEKQTLQASTTPGQATTASAGITSGINAMHGGGQPLTPTARGFMEPRFGHDFSQVRVHADGNAARTAKQINARAFTVGRDIAFGAGQYQPGTPRGKKLLAHELTHVVQQNYMTLRRKSASPPLHSANSGMNSPGSASPPNHHPQAVLNRLGTGRAFSGSSRARMESAFGRDFSHVRLHTDPAAASLSQHLNAQAFAVGNHIAFAPGSYQPDTMYGDVLIAHELAHVMQQSTASSTDTVMELGDTQHTALEQEADASAAHVVTSLWGRTKTRAAGIAKNAVPTLKSGLRLSRCVGKKCKTYEKKKLNCTQICDLAYTDPCLNKGGGGVVCYFDKKCPCVFDVPPMKRGECPNFDKIVLTHEKRHLTEGDCESGKVHRLGPKNPSKLAKFECPHRKESRKLLDEAIKTEAEPCKGKMKTVRDMIDKWVKANC